MLYIYIHICTRTHIFILYNCLKLVLPNFLENLLSSETFIPYRITPQLGTINLIQYIDN